MLNIAEDLIALCCSVTVQQGRQLMIIYLTDGATL